MKKVIITGGTGSIGVALINTLLIENCEVLALVRAKPERLIKQFNNNNLTVKEVDFNNLEKIDIKDIGDDYDVLYHLAWEGVRGTSRLEENMQSKNVGMTLKVLELGYRAGCRKFIGAGSQAEYGLCSGKISEDQEESPDTEYGIAKIKACEESRKIADKFSMIHIWTRIFSIYGPNDYEKTLISSLIINMLENKDIDVTECIQIWDYLYIRRLC